LTPHRFLKKRKSNLAQHLVFLLLFVFCYGVCNAQTEPIAGDRDIIDIIGLNYGRLQIKIESDQAADNQSEDTRQMLDLLERNLLWSGMFDIQESIDKADLLLKISHIPNRKIHSRIFSQEEILLFDEFINQEEGVPFEKALLEMVEAIIYQLTGERSIFKSAIAYVRKDMNSATAENNTVKYEIVLTDTFGSKSRVVFNDGNINILPRWNPDGKSLLFTALGEKGSRIRKLDLNSGHVQTMFHEMGKLSGGTWGKDGQELIITRFKKGNADLYRIDQQGRILEQVTSRTSSESNPSWSPDSSRLLFVSNRSGNVHIYQKDFEYNEVFRMTFEGTYNVEPCWSNDGANIVFSGMTDSGFQLFMMDKDGQYIQQLTHGNQSAEQPIWSPYGRQILFVSKVGFDQKLFMIRADGTLKRRLTDSGPGIEEFNPTWTPSFKWSDTGDQKNAAE